MTGAHARPWVQAAIDVEDIDLAKKIAFMALDAGAEWLEVGTPLLYQYGHRAIGMLRRAVGSNAVLVADYKSPFAALCAEQAAREGADFVLLSAGYTEFALRHSIEFCRKAGIQPIFDLSVRPQDMRAHTEKLVALGAEYIFSRHYAQVSDAAEDTKRVDNIQTILSGEKNFTLGITSDDLEEAVSAARSGADWITFGWVLRKPDPAVCRRWIDAIHSACEEDATDAKCQTRERV